jgi:hypothetical protein
MAPERLYIETAKNVAADETCAPLNDDHRAMERGRTVREYARG